MSTRDHLAGFRLPTTLLLWLMLEMVAKLKPRSFVIRAAYHCLDRVSSFTCCTTDVMVSNLLKSEKQSGGCTAWYSLKSKTTHFSPQICEYLLDFKINCGIVFVRSLGQLLRSYLFGFTIVLKLTNSCKFMAESAFFQKLCPKTQEISPLILFFWRQIKAFRAIIMKCSI